MTRRKLLVFAVVLGAIGAGAGAYYNLRRPGGPPEVATAPVARGDVIDRVSATGTLEAVTTVQVGTQVSGTIQQLDADFNSIVRRGQVIARLDPSLFQTQVDQARANQVRAEADVERLRVTVADAATKLTRAEGLAARSLIPQSELDTARVNVQAAQAQLRSAQAQLTQARASLNQAEVNLRHTVIETPIDGIVISRNVDVGQTVAASMQAPTLFVIAADLTRMKVNANIDEADVGRIRPGQHVTFRVDAHPTEDFAGTVSQVRLQPVVVQNVVTYATVIDVPNGELKLKPGMTAQVNIEIARRSDVLRVPNTALRFRPTPDIFAALGQTAPPDTPRPAELADAQPPKPPPAGQMPPPSGIQPAPDASRQPAADPSGRGDARGERAGPDMDPDRRRQFMERMQNLPPEERARMMERFRTRRGTDPGGEPPQRPRREGAPRDEQRPEESRPATRRGAQTIDSLFGPLPATETRGRVWLFVNGQLKPVRLRLGISDGSFTEVIGEELQPPAEVVTGVRLPSESAPAPGTGGPRSPFMPGGRGPGGPPGVRNSGQRR